MGATSTAWLRTPLLPAGVLLAALAGEAAAEVKESVRYSTYRVEQAPGAPLRSALDSATTIRQAGKVFHAYTSWDVRWQFYWHEDAGGRCAITDVSTALSVEILLPQLVSGNPHAAARFASYVEALRQHEQGHYGIAQSAAQRIDRRIRDLPPVQGCARLQAQANQIGYDLLESAQREEQAYDHATHHGRTQGAWLPH